jgi:ubiquinone/menaquinone biosynthesis C-methylase UbiE
MTTADSTQFKEIVRDQWTSAAEVWTRWHPQFSEMSREATKLICDAAQLRDGLSVLDLAGGTGEPGLTAAQRVAPGGTVTCTDYVPEMVATAEANARAAGITNMNFQQVDAEDISFPDDSFDRVISRFGLMFPPDTQKALGEIKRVLKPDGRVAFTVWQAVDKNPWFNDINRMLIERQVAAPPPPGMPTPFRFGQPGSVTKELEAAGFRDVKETPVEISWVWPGPPEEFREFAKTTSAGWRRGLEQADKAARKAALDAMLEIIARSYDGSRINQRGNIFVVSAAA